MPLCLVYGILFLIDTINTILGDLESLVGIIRPLTSILGEKMHQGKAAILPAKGYKLEKACCLLLAPVAFAILEG